MLYCAKKFTKAGWIFYIWISTVISKFAMAATFLFHLSQTLSLWFLEKLFDKLKSKASQSKINPFRTL